MHFVNLKFVNVIIIFRWFYVLLVWYSWRVILTLMDALFCNNRRLIILNSVLRPHYWTLKIRRNLKQILVHWWNFFRYVWISLKKQSRLFNFEIYNLFGFIFHFDLFFAWLSHRIDAHKKVCNFLSLFWRLLQNWGICRHLGGWPVTVFFDSVINLWLLCIIADLLTEAILYGFIFLFR